MSNSDLNLEALSGAELEALDQMLETRRVPVMGSAVPLDLTDLGATPSQTPGLELVHEAFARFVGIEFERATRTTGTVRAMRPEIIPFSEVYARMPSPAGIILVDLAALECNGLLTFDINLLFHFIDLIMGGPGGDSNAAALVRNRSFTATEKRLVGHLVDHVSVALEKAWADIVPLSLATLRAEVDKRHAAVIRPSERVVAFTVDLMWEDVRGEISLIVPYRGLRPFGRKLEFVAIQSGRGDEDAWSEEIAALLHEVPVTLTAVLGRAEMTLRQVMDLEVGSTLRLDSDPNSPVELQVEGRPRFAVQPTSLNGNVAFTLVGVVGDDASPSKD